MRSPKGNVVGVLDIAKCLYDAVTRLQRAAEKKTSGGEKPAHFGKGKGKQSKAAMQVCKRAGRRVEGPRRCYPCDAASVVGGLVLFGGV